MFGKAKSKKEKKKESLTSFLFFIVLALTVRWGLAEAYVIPTGSMLPSLLINDHIFVNKIVYGLRVPFSTSWLWQFREPKRGEVIVFKDPRDGKALIKRVIGLPGDKVLYRDNQLYINDKLVENKTPSDEWDFDWLRDKDVENNKAAHEYLTEELDHHPHSVLHIRGEFDPGYGPVTVPEKSMVMFGDHRDNSGDSRVFGFAPMENILGKAMFVWLSCDDSIPIIEMGCNPMTIRWRRFFHWVN